jgi:TolA-binding protein
LLVAAAAVHAGRAGLFDDEEARPHRALRVEVTELASASKSINRNQIDFANQVEAVKADIAKLRGQIEVLTYELEATQKRQKDFYVDLDNRCASSSAPAEAKPEATEARRSRPGNPRLRSRAGQPEGGSSSRKPAPPSSPSSRPTRTAACRLGALLGWLRPRPGQGSRQCRRTVRQVCRRLADR